VIDELLAQGQTMYRVDGHINVRLICARCISGKFEETNVSEDDLDSQGKYGTLLQSTLYFHLALLCPSDRKDCKIVMPPFSEQTIKAHVGHETMPFVRELET